MLVTCNSSLVRQLPQKREAKYSSVVTVGEMEVERVAADDRRVLKRNIFRDPRVVEHLFTGPFVDASRTRT